VTVTAAPEPTAATGPVRRVGAARAAATITATELRRVSRDRLALFFIIVLPIVVTVLIGVTIGAAPERFRVAVLDLDGSVESTRLVEALRGAPALIVVDADDGRSGIDQGVLVGSLSAGVVIPPGYGGAVRSGGPATVTLVADPGVGSTGIVRSAVTGVVDAQGSTLGAAAFATEIAGGGPSANLAVAERLRDALEPVTVRVEALGREVPETNSFSYTAPSNLVLFVFINTVTGGGALVESRRLGVTRRMLAAPLRASSIVAGFAASRFVFALLQAVLIVVVAGVVFGVRWGDPVGAALVIVLFSLVATGAGVLVGAVARTADQTTAVGIPVSIALGMLGGCMWPLEIVGPAMRTVGHLTPHAWAMDAWLDLIWDGEGLGAIWPDLAVLAGFATALLTLAAWRLRVALGA
jgi:ABC-2 type transport system permease protein